MLHQSIASNDNHYGTIHLGNFQECVRTLKGLSTLMGSCMNELMLGSAISRNYYVDIWVYWGQQGCHTSRTPVTCQAYMYGTEAAGWGAHQRALYMSPYKLCSGCEESAADLSPTSKSFSMNSCYITKFGRFRALL